jgi:hypothetical protein
MTGNQLISTFDEIVANDLYPVFASTTVQKLDAFNNAKRQIFRMLNYPAIDVPVTVSAGVQTYSLNSLATPIYLATKVTLNNAVLDSDQYYQIADQLTLIPTIAAGNTVLVSGFKRGSLTVADNNEVTDLPVDLHIPLVYLAIRSACGSQEDAPEQLARLQAMESLALQRVLAYTQIQSRADFPF